MCPRVTEKRYCKRVSVCSTKNPEIFVIGFSWMRFDQFSPMFFFFCNKLGKFTDTVRHRVREKPIFFTPFVLLRYFQSILFIRKKTIDSFFFFYCVFYLVGDRRRSLNIKLPAYEFFCLCIKIKNKSRPTPVPYDMITILLLYCNYCLGVMWFTIVEYLLFSRR